MTYHDATAPDPTASEGSVELVIKPNAKDLGGFTVRRVLPSRDRQMVGPFIFFDHMGPAEFPPGKGIEVRPLTTMNPSASRMPRSPVLMRWGRICSIVPSSRR